MDNFFSDFVGNVQFTFVYPNLNDPGFHSSRDGVIFRLNIIHPTSSPTFAAASLSTTFEFHKNFTSLSTQIDGVIVRLCDPMLTFPGSQIETLIFTAFRIVEVVDERPPL